VDGEGVKDLCKVLETLLKGISSKVSEEVEVEVDSTSTIFLEIL